MSTPIVALENALYNSNQSDNRKTFGKVEYALIPVSVIEDVLADYNAPESQSEAPEPTTVVPGLPPGGFPDNEDVLLFIQGDGEEE